MPRFPQERFLLALLIGAVASSSGLAQDLSTGANRYAGVAFAACTLKFKDTDYPTGVLPQAVAVGDFNNDGIPDFAQINNNGGGAGSVDIYLGNGDGTFKLKGGVYPAGAGPDALAVADLNGDGNLDLVVADDEQASVGVLLGRGDGIFPTIQLYKTGSFPHGAALADFNGDNKPDIAVTNSVDNSVGVLLNNGDGTFGAMQTFATGAKPNSVAAADFNHDGNTDLAVTGYKANVVSILLGNGDGTFGNRNNYATGAAPTAIVAGDFNRDHKIDLAIAASNKGQAGGISILLGSGDGSFQPHADYATGLGPAGLVVGIFNGDRFADIAVANFGGNTMSVLPGNGDGTFGAPIDFTTDNGPFGLAVGQFHGNGKTKQDIVVTDQFNTTVTVFLNKSSCK